MNLIKFLFWLTQINISRFIKFLIIFEVKIKLYYNLMKLFYSLVMEYADNGDVFQKICSYQKRETYIKEKKIWYIFIQIVRGLKALHDRKILHRDMKVSIIINWI